MRETKCRAGIPQAKMYGDKARMYGEDVALTSFQSADIAHLAANICLIGAMVETCFSSSVHDFALDISFEESRPSSAHLVAPRSTTVRFYETATNLT